MDEDPGRVVSHACETSVTARPSNRHPSAASTPWQQRFGTLLEGGAHNASLSSLDLNSSVIANFDPSSVDGVTASAAFSSTFQSSNEHDYGSDYAFGPLDQGICTEKRARY